MASNLPFKNDGSFMETFMQMQGKQVQSDKAKHSKPEPSPPIPPEAPFATPSSETASTSASFMPSSQFTGAKEGYAFKLGPEGVGYYEDKKPIVSEPKGKADKSLKPAPSKPLVIKSNKSIARVQVQNTESKRRKLGDEEKPFYLKEMERYRTQSCSADTKHERPLVK